MANITVTKVGVLSIGKLVGTVNLIVALAIGIIAATVGTVTYLSSGIADGFFEGLFASFAIIVFGVLLYPALLFALGWLYGVVFAFIFNVVVGVSGGIELSVTEEKPASRK